MPGPKNSFTILIVEIVYPLCALFPLSAFYRMAAVSSAATSAVSSEVGGGGHPKAAASSASVAAPTVASDGSNGSDGISGLGSRSELYLHKFPETNYILNVYNNNKDQLCNIFQTTCQFDDDPDYKSKTALLTKYFTDNKEDG